MRVKITANFYEHEFLNPIWCKKIPANRQARARALCLKTLEPIRAANKNRSMTITPNGGYRTYEQDKNLKLGRVSRSKHKDMRAADFKVRSKAEGRRMFYLIDAMMKDGRIPKGGLACYGSFVHVDNRGWCARWKANP